MDSSYLIDHIIYLDKHRYDLKNLLEKLSVVLKKVVDMETEKKKIFWEWMEHVFAVSVNEKYGESIRKIIDEAKGEEGMFKYAITDMIETTIREESLKSRKQGRKQGRRQGRRQGLREGREEGRMAELICIIMNKLDQGLSAESIAYWLGKEKEFVEEIQRLHRAEPEADVQRLVKLYNSGNKKTGKNTESQGAFIKIV